MRLQIPVESYVHEFLTSNEMLGSGIIKVRRDSLIGTLIIMIASKGPIGLNEYHQDRFTPKQLECEKRLEVELTFPMRMSFIPEENLGYIGEILGRLFEYQVIFFSLGYTARAGSERGAITKLYNLYGMADEPIKMEALRSICKRHRYKVMENEQNKKANHFV